VACGCRRYLRARKWSIQEAFKQFQDTEDWRKANEVDVLYESFDDEAFEQSRRMVCIQRPTLSASGRRRRGWPGAGDSLTL